MYIRLFQIKMATQSSCSNTESVLDPSLDESFEEFIIENDGDGGSEIIDSLDNDKDALYMYV